MSKIFLVFLLVSIIAGRRSGGGGGSRGSSGTYKNSGTYSRKTGFFSTKRYRKKRNPITGIMETRKKQPARRRYQAEAVDCSLREAKKERVFLKVITSF